MTHSTEDQILELCCNAAMLRERITVTRFIVKRIDDSGREA